MKKITKVLLAILILLIILVVIATFAHPEEQQEIEKQYLKLKIF